MFCSNCVTKLPVYRMNYVDPAFVCKKCELTCLIEVDFTNITSKYFAKVSHTSITQLSVQNQWPFVIQVRSFIYQTRKIQKKLMIVA